MKISKRLSRTRTDLPSNSFLLFLLGAPLRRFKRILSNRAISKATSSQDRFTLIYERNAWGSIESASGIGSTLEFTESIRSLLPVLLKRFQIKSIFDAPCGDFNWMRQLDLKGIEYVGADIVSPLIVELQKKYSAPSVTFKHLDLTKEPFPKSDLVLNRDCLFHLSFSDILAVLNNFVISDSKYFLSTSHDNEVNFSNLDIRSGDFRPIDLFASPFNFPTDFLFEIPEPGDGNIPARKIYLWNREQVLVAQSNLEHYLRGL